MESLFKKTDSSGLLTKTQTLGIVGGTFLRGSVIVFIFLITQVILMYSQVQEPLL